MKFKKIYGYFISILLMFYLMLPTNVIAGGQWKGDNFDSYPIGAWVPPTNGWQSLNNKMWSITYGMLAGHVLWFTPNESDLFVHPSDTSDYEISVQINHSLIPTPAYTAGLVGRRSDNYNYYSCDIYTDTSHITRLVLRKYWMQENPYIVATVVMNSIICFMDDIDPNIYYTLSMKVRGSDITATLSGMPAIPPVSVSYTDDGIKYGPVLTGGYVGIYSRAAVSFHPYFDNFTYRNLIKRPQPWLMLLLGD